MVNLDEFPNAESILDLDGAGICVAIGSTSAGNMADFFNENDMDYTAVNSWNEAGDFVNEQCDAVTGDMSALVAGKWQIEQDGSADFEDGDNARDNLQGALGIRDEGLRLEWNEVVSRFGSAWLPPRVGGLFSELPECGYQRASDRQAA